MLGIFHVFVVGSSFVLFDLILYIPSTIFQLNRDGSSWVEPVLSSDKCVLFKDHNTVTPVRLESAAPGSQVKHSTTEPLPSIVGSSDSDSDRNIPKHFTNNPLSNVWLLIYLFTLRLFLEH